MPCPFHPPWLDRSIILGEEYKLWSSSWCSLLLPPVSSSLFGPNILNTLFSNTLSLSCLPTFLDINHRPVFLFRTKLRRLDFVSVPVYFSWAQPTEPEIGSNCLKTEAESSLWNVFTNGWIVPKQSITVLIYNRQEVLNLTLTQIGSQYFAEIIFTSV
jgi:hypothetical protein